MKRNGDGATYYIRRKTADGCRTLALHHLDDGDLEGLIFDCFEELARRTIQRARIAALPRVVSVRIDDGARTEAGRP